MTLRSAPRADAALLTGLSPSSSVWTGLVPGFALLSLGLGAAFVTATTAAMTGLPHQEMGLASATPAAHPTAHSREHPNHHLIDVFISLWSESRPSRVHPS